MIPWSAKMWPTFILHCLLATWLVTSIGAITVSIDRSDKKPPPTRSSMIANGWRPLTNSYEETIGTNVSPASNLERNAPVHPVLGKFQEHMATSEKLKPQRKIKPPPQHDYNPPSILGSFTVFGHAAAKARGEAQTQNHLNKHIPAETQEYTFLIPPPKDVYRFELDHHRKPILRDNNAYLRQPQFGPPNVHQPPDPIRAATYFIKGYTSTTNTPSSPNSSKNRHYQNGGYPMPPGLQPPRHQAKPFESLKTNVKPYFQPPGTAPAPEFGKDKRGNEHDHRSNYDRFQSHSHNGQMVSPPNAGNFYSQVNHPPHSYKTSFERDPAFLVHESHEVSYVTQPSVYNGYNLRPSLPYETLLPPDIYSSSTPAPTTVSPRVHGPNKYSQSNDVIREQDYKRPGHGAAIKQADNTVQSEVLPTSGIGSTYYVSEHQDLTPPPSAWPVPKSKYTSDINEVLPKVHAPSKFSQDVINNNQIPEIPKVFYVRPPMQQYPSSVLPIDTRPENAEPEYETPESISLKHFNEQQFLIQQQLIERDRQRLAEQERQQQLEIQRQQQEELRKRQKELKELIRQQKEEEESRLAVESAKNQSEQFGKVTDEQTPYTIQLAEYEIPKVTTASAPVVPELSTFGEQPKIQESQVIQEQIVTGSPGQNQQYQQELENQQYQEELQNQQYQEQLQSQQYQEQLQNQQYQEQLQNQQYQEQLQNQQHQEHLRNQHYQEQYQNHQYQEQIQNQPEEEQVNYREQQPDSRPHRPKKPSRDQYRRRKPTTVAYEPTPTVLPIQVPETSVPLTLHIEDVPVQTTATPEITTLPTVTTQRPRVRRPGSGLRRRRPTTTTEESVTVSNGEEYLKYERPEEVQQQQLDSSRRRRIKPTQSTFEESVTERRPNIRKRPGHRNRVNPGEPFEAEIVTEIVHTPLNTYKDPTESVLKYYENNQYVTNQPNNQYLDYTSQRLVPTDEQREDTTEAVQLEYLTEITRNRAEDFPGNNDHNRQEEGNVVTKIPLEDLFIRTEGNYFDRASALSPTSTTTSTTTPATTTAVQPTTESPPVVSSTARPQKMRPLRYGNTTRPRFSIKDYKSRLDYKGRLSQQSSTEASVTHAPHTKQRGSTLRNQQPQNQQPQPDDATRETTGRYKYMSRANYRTTSTAPSTIKNQDYTSTDGVSSTTEKSNRFVPKRRPISSNVYRSRISATTGSPNRSQQHHESETHSKPSTARPENVFSSSVRRRPIMKSRLPALKETSLATHTHRKEEAATEMTAEETSFYSAVTTMASTRFVANEIPVEKGESSSTNDPVKFNSDEGRNEEKSETRPSFQLENESAPTEPVRLGSTVKSNEENQLKETRIPEQEPTANTENNPDFMDKKSDVDSTPKFSISTDEEELFAKASQSVADLTSSASALYDKPGMFKAVSPESRVVASHFKITTDEPTLPIEAFFQELSKKN